MIKPNWEIFKAKFTDNPQANFEWFCYLLFCNEFKKPYGIFRYKNQSAIENNPIKVDAEVIGWQAKFYDTSLSNHKDELLSTIIKAKRDYSSITKLFFYTNKEWGQNKGKKPKGLVEIEGKAEELKIILEWRATSFFESEFVSVQNTTFAKHFFTQDPNVFNQLEEQENHSTNILREIHTSIIFKGKNIEIERRNYIDDLRSSKYQVSILCGTGGIGKTAVIKKYIEELGEGTPCYVFKATEFELRNINEIFTHCSLNEFIDTHTHEKTKIIIIDSAEKLLDVRNSDPIKEFLSVLVKNKWRVIFTTRDIYLEDLNYLFIEVYKLPPFNLNIPGLKDEELHQLGKEYSFTLPSDEKLFELLKTPFYLNKYLQFHKDDDQLAYREFKKQLWDKDIKKSKPARESCFLEVAFARANEGQFYIKPNCSSAILDNELVMDGVLGNETAGYFITHDIYEEWALEEIINAAYINKLGILNFFQTIGQSLPIRRSFRNWVSEQLLLETSDIKSFIEEIIDSQDIEQFWKDEIIVSILLSDYSETFFLMFKGELLAQDCELLKRITFLLRIACKEANTDFSKTLGVIKDIKYLFTQPKGQGWKSLIKFTHKNINTIGVNNLNFILPVVHDWNSKYKNGPTTRLSSLTALKYYEYHLEQDSYFYDRDLKEKVFQTITNGSKEISNELKEIISQTVNIEGEGEKPPYSGLIKYILTKIDCLHISYLLPEEILLLASFVWREKIKPTNDYLYDDFHQATEKAFCLTTDHGYQYFPASAYQTPIHALLKSSFKNTIDFILRFTNQSVDCYSKSKYEENIKEVSVYISDDLVVKQFHANSLWLMFRGTSSPVTPYLLQSIHMALEKSLLEIFKDSDAEVVESWLIYLLKKSKSSSISSVVTSIVLAYPDKTFKVALILFKTKEFIRADLNRCISEHQTKSLYSIGAGFDFHNTIHQEERLNTCKDEHRNQTLENLFLNYQLFKNNFVTDEQVRERQNNLWFILDNYYEKLPSKKDESNEDKVWRLFLARMDKRKMDFEVIETDDGKVGIQITTDLDSDLKEYRENSLAESSDNTKYISLKLWADFKFNKDEKYKEYIQYEENPSLAIEEVKSILNTLKPRKSSDHLSLTFLEDDSFSLLNYSTPSFVCSVLIRDKYEQLTEEEIYFCKKIILETASLPFRQGYYYQISDGTQPAISVLPILLQKLKDDDKNVIKVILLLLLFFEYHAGGHGSFSSYPIRAIYSLWEESFSDAQDILLGFLLLKPKYDTFADVVRERNFDQGIHNFSSQKALEKFVDENGKFLETIVEGNVSSDFLKNSNKLEISILNTAFQLVPNKTENKDHKVIVEKVVLIFAEKILSDDRANKLRYEQKHSFLDKYAHFVLSSSESNIPDYLAPFLDNLTSTESVADLLKAFVLAEDELHSYDNFWLVWGLFKIKIYEICKNGDSYSYISNIIKSYLFASVTWKKTAKEWRSFKETDKKFFKDVSKNLGHCPSTLYSISKLLYGIGNCYLHDGVLWISGIIKNNDLLDKKLEVNTVFYLENIVRKYTLENHEKVKKARALKNELLVILDFLIEKGSVVGYMLRERIV